MRQQCCPLDQGPVRSDLRDSLNVRQNRSPRSHFLPVIIASGETDPQQKHKNLLDACAQELSVKWLEWVIFKCGLVAGAGFEPAAFRL